MLIRATGLVQNAVPAVAVADGCVWMVNRVAAPALTVTAALVFAVNTAAASVAVTVRVPAVLNVRLDNVAVPAIKVKYPAVAPLSSAIVALASVLLNVTFGVAVPTTFQFASTAFTTIELLITMPAISSAGV